MVVDAAHVGDIGLEVGQATPHGPPGGERINRVRRHPDLLQQAGVGILEIDTRNPVAASGECRKAAVVHREQSGFVAALFHSVNEVKEIRFRTAKRIIVLVAIQDPHSHRPRVEAVS